MFSRFSPIARITTLMRTNTNDPFSNVCSSYIGNEPTQGVNHPFLYHTSVMNKLLNRMSEISSSYPMIDWLPAHLRDLLVDIQMFGTCFASNQKGHQFQITHHIAGEMRTINFIIDGIVHKNVTLPNSQSAAYFIDQIKHYCNQGGILIQDRCNGSSITHFVKHVLSSYLAYSNTIAIEPILNSSKLYDKDDILTLIATTTLKSLNELIISFIKYGIPNDIKTRLDYKIKRALMDKQCSNKLWTEYEGVVISSNQEHYRNNIFKILDEYLLSLHATTLMSILDSKNADISSRINQQIFLILLKLINSTYIKLDDIIKKTLFNKWFTGYSFEHYRVQFPLQLERLYSKKERINQAIAVLQCLLHNLDQESLNELLLSGTSSVLPATQILLFMAICHLPLIKNVHLERLKFLDNFIVNNDTLIEQLYSNHNQLFATAFTFLLFDSALAHKLANFIQNDNEEMSGKKPFHVETRVQLAKHLAWKNKPNSGTINSAEAFLTLHDKMQECIALAVVNTDELKRYMEIFQQFFPEIYRAYERFVLQEALETMLMAEYSAQELVIINQLDPHSKAERMLHDIQARASGLLHSAIQPTFFKKARGEVDQRPALQRFYQQFTNKQIMKIAKEFTRESGEEIEIFDYSLSTKGICSLYYYFLAKNDQFLLISPASARALYIQKLPLIRWTKQLAKLESSDGLSSSGQESRFTALSTKHEIELALQNFEHLQLMYKQYCTLVETSIFYQMMLHIADTGKIAANSLDEFYEKAACALLFKDAFTLSDAVVYRVNDVLEPLFDEAAKTYFEYQCRPDTGPDADAELINIKKRSFDAMIAGQGITEQTFNKIMNMLDCQDKSIHEKAYVLLCLALLFLGMSSKEKLGSETGSVMPLANCALCILIKASKLLPGVDSIVSSIIGSYPSILHRLANYLIDNALFSCTHVLSQQLAIKISEYSSIFTTIEFNQKAQQERAAAIVPTIFPNFMQIH